MEILFVLKAPLRWLRKLYTWTLRWARAKHAPWALFCIAFMESSFFPVPPDVLLIAMVVADKKKWVRFAFICTLGSVCGALLGYAIGWGFYETVGKLIVKIYHLEHVIEVVGQKYAENAFFTVFTAAFTPIPYKIITIAAGLFRISLTVLIIASVIGRGARFFLVSSALRIFGRRIEHSIEKYFDVFSIIFILLIIIGFLLLRFVFK